MDGGLGKGEASQAGGLSCSGSCPALAKGGYSNGSPARPLLARELHALRSEIVSCLSDTNVVVFEAFLLLLVSRASGKEELGNKSLS